MIEEILGPVRAQVVDAALGLASFQNAYGKLSRWQAFALTLCFGMREVLDAAIESRDVDGRRGIANLIRLADDAMFATQWIEAEWWAYVARTRSGRDTLALIQHVERLVDEGGLGHLAIYAEFSDTAKAGRWMMEQCLLERHTSDCKQRGEATSI